MIPPSGPLRTVFLIAGISGLLGLVTMAIFTWYDATVEQKQTAEWLEETRAAGLDASETLDDDLSRLSDRADEIADWIETTGPDVDAIEDRLRTTVDETPQIFGIGVGFTPYSYAPDVELKSRYLIRENNGRQMVAIEDHYDYTAEISEADWYRRGLEDPGWQEPIFGDISQALIVMYCAPFSSGDEVDDDPDGVVCVNYSIEDVWRLVADLGLGEAGYPMVLTAGGQFVVHPRREYVLDERNIRDVATGRDDDQLLDFADRLDEAETGFFDYHDPLVGEQGQIFYTPIVETNWTMATVVYDIEIPRDWLAYRHRQVIMTFTGVVTVVLLTLAAMATRRFSDRWLWIGSIIATLALLVGIGRLWGLTSTELERDPPDSVRLVDPGEATRFVDDYSDDVEARFHVTPHRIGTGLVIDNLELREPNRFEVSGVVWCRYDLVEDADLARRIVFPDAVDGEARLEEVMRYREAGTEVVGWRFETVIQHDPDISWFPLDVRRLPIRLWHAEFDRHVVLVPELHDYSPVHPRALPGTRQNMELLGWQTYRSLFVFRFHDYGVDVGPIDISSRGEFPELTYYTVAQRQLTEAVLSHMMPLWIALILMFAVALLETRGREKADVMGFTAVRVLSVVTAIFFALVVSHIDVRRRFMADELMYIDYFYFITYLMIAIGAANGYLISSPDHQVRLLDYADNLIPKVLFWPISLGLVFAVTAVLVY